MVDGFLFPSPLWRASEFRRRHAAGYALSTGRAGYARTLSAVLPARRAASAVSTPPHHIRRYTPLSLDDDGAAQRVGLSRRGDTPHTRRYHEALRSPDHGAATAMTLAQSPSITAHFIPHFAMPAHDRLFSRQESAACRGKAIIVIGDDDAGRRPNSSRMARRRHAMGESSALI